MDGYPNEEEEFELMYGDDLDMVRSQTFENYSAPPPSSLSTQEQSHNTDHRKRTINELFGDIDDIDESPVEEKEIQLPIPKKFKATNNDNVEKLALIEHILELRREAKANLNNIGSVNPHKFREFQEKLRDKISIRVPQYPFTAVTTNSGDRLYIRTHSEEFWHEDIKSVSEHLHHADFGSTLGINFEDVWSEAQVLSNKTSENNEIVEIYESITEEDNKLWVELYKPKKYMDLLSDESTNRTLLRWVKLWDRVVFNRRTKVTNAQLNGFLKNFLEVEADHRPKYKIALLAGPPGLGKTTLAHLVALHAGYKPMEVNASDDRSPDSFKKVLENGTTMTSVLDAEKRPNCIIFDEIDGAPTNAIEYLCKYVQGGIKIKTKKGAGGAEGKKDLRKILRRPIIAICNDAYVPALRGLRQIAIVLHVPPITPSRLTERLTAICSHEDIVINRPTLTALSEKSNCDVRNCLSLLHFFKAKSSINALNTSCKVTLEQVLESNHSKDVHKGLFELWSDIFYLKRNKDNSLPTSTQRCRNIQSVINNFDVEKLASGVFENYVRLCSVKDNMDNIARALDWFTWMDNMNKKMRQEQNYQLGTYLNWAFVQWHFAFANLPTNKPSFTGTTFQDVKQTGKSFGKANAGGGTKISEKYPTDNTKIIFPSGTTEVRLQTQKTDAIMSDLLKHMSPQIRVYYNKNSLKLDVLPMLKYIINPALRPVNSHLYTPHEKEELARLVSTMIDYGLNYVQERTKEGTYTFNLDPNIDELTTYSTVKIKSGRTSSYSNRQLVAREIEMEKMRRLEISKNKNMTQTQQEARRSFQPHTNKGKPENQLLNHLAKLTPKKIKPNTEQNSRNFFSFTKNNTDETESGSSKTNKAGLGDIYFKFKEGYTNAVKRKVKIANLL